MKNTTYILLIILCFANAACHKKSAISKVEFAKSFCYGHCVAAAISVDSSLTIKMYTDSSQDWDFKGKRPAIRSYKGKVSREYWEQLTAMLEDAGYQHIDKVKKESPADVQRSEFMVFTSGTNYWIDNSSEEITRLKNWIDSTSRYINFKRVPDTLCFWTTRQLDPRMTH